MCVVAKTEVPDPFVAEGSGQRGKRSYLAMSLGWQLGGTMCGGSSGVVQRGTELPPANSGHGLVHVAGLSGEGSPRASSRHPRGITGGPKNKNK